MKGGGYRRQKPAKGETKTCRCPDCLQHNENGKLVSRHTAWRHQHRIAARAIACQPESAAKSYGTADDIPDLGSGGKSPSLYFALMS
jgi:hypothetical protein